ncbi:electron transfer flavoprotein-ubiquinone oxidoreductase [Ochrobactrum quorumnocens]|uniref:Electron transfer flavoprotein-ubiquinone oxidoreductase n=1 Tax=Ochrobactrum quorumnocens TaxID=271865 RepID=A0A248UEE8_9HYPH|nr:electron transfer flavoprotein-ubiquinone oxidoreductase [[Ochrobactrum] quorumnocens]ASV85058.1 HI0933-like family protein [[Ochrobactrum] quorumnocens]KAA9370632.1 electron transfer flavoprotein-ubiquinone oxidoreductase [[Ochrobactrum] quorumnocens]MBD7990300.1 electron transfer flavoprotein-ubiquinone oxidoreductase [Ochrobactrum gallinarum]
MSEAPAIASQELPERESMEFDIVIVGAGPAGLAAAIRFKQINPEFSVVVLEKGGEVGAHILSGAVVDPSGIDQLLPGWRDEEGHPFKTPVTADHFLLLGPAGSVRLPNFAMPPLMNNHGNYIVSLGNVCRWLGTKAEELGVEIYPGFAATEVLYNDEGAVIGVATGDMGIERDGTHGPNYTRGMALLGKYVLIGEGARGSLAKELIAKFKLDEGREPAKFGIGLKELWQVDPSKHKPGLVQHSFGWPLDMKTGGGSFLYHLEDNMVAVGFVLHLNYKNPYLAPFEEFQRFKTHPAIRDTFEGGKRLSYGARAITEGGFQSVPKLSFPGGALIGCSAGFVNVPRIKGSHNAVLSGILAADKIAEALAAGRANDEPIEIENSWRDSAIGKDLKRVRNVKPLWSKFGTVVGVALGGLDMWTNQLFGFSFFGTLKHGKTDAQALEPAAKHKKITYPKPDGVLTFDRLSSVFLSNTNHDENEPVHLQVADVKLQQISEHDVFAGPSTRYCPAGVYEWVDADGNSAADPQAKDVRFVINAQNCVHCKTCDIKDPNQNINWVPPQGGEGPVYVNM